MCTRVYILLKTTKGKSDKVAQDLRLKPGVVMVDLVLLKAHRISS
jgi:hypothetical protein